MHSITKRDKIPFQQNLYVAVTFKEMKLQHVHILIQHFQL